MLAVSEINRAGRSESKTLFSRRSYFQISPEGKKRCRVQVPEPSTTWDNIEAGKDLYIALEGGKRSGIQERGKEGKGGSLHLPAKK